MTTDTNPKNRSDGIQRKLLHPYQIEGIEFALKNRNTLIADEMGLGKTVQAIGYINANPEITSVIITCPKSLLINWYNEIDEWLDRPKGTVQITICHYDALSKLEVTEIDLLVIDEAQFIKNAKTKRHKETRAISKRAKHVMLLTGTPMENKPLELWPLLQILKPEVWDPPGFIKQGKGKDAKRVKVGAGEGANFFSFAKRYCGAKKITFGYGLKAKSHWDFSGASNLDELNEWLRKTGMIRRLKKNVLSQLPPKIRQVVVLPNTLGSDPEILRNVYENLGCESCDYLAVISSLTTNKVAFTEWSKVRKEQGLAKIGSVVEHVERCLENGAVKIILFAHHKEVILGLAGNLNFYGSVFLTSEMSPTERQDAVDVFNEDPNCKIIIGSFGVMGTGYSMNIADMVICAEVDPVPGRMLQAEDRGHRLGRDRVLHVQYLVLDNTIEARICKIFAKKLDVLGKVLDQ